MPSCEELPSLKNLAETVKENKRNGWEAFDPSSESQVTVFFFSLHCAVFGFYFQIDKFVNAIM